LCSIFQEKDKKESRSEEMIKKKKGSIKRKEDGYEA
jgi:hypothetical protein